MVAAVGEATPAQVGRAVAAGSAGGWAAAAAGWEPWRPTRC